MEEVIELLKQAGFTEAGTTRVQSYRTHSFAFGGGPIVTTGGRLRFTKGNWIVTVGKKTTCFSLKPERPETISGRGQLIGQRVMTFQDWKQDNFPTKDIEAIRRYIQQLLQE
jgi:hypothetical protein